MSERDLKRLESHFAFGENWAAYARLIGEAEIARAEEGLTRLVPREELAGASFIDIGSGSGLHALAAARLGASRILAVDIDPASVATTRKVLAGAPLSVPWEAREASVFELDPAVHGSFDVVYSWGVLHHTGSMWEAVARAAALVAPGGLLAFALYRRTRLDAFWKLEKRLYSRSPRPVQALLRAGYVGAFRVGLAVSRKGSFADYVAGYRSRRGMDFHHDVHDWLGGYPYESALAPEVEARLAGMGLKPERVLARPLELGLLGSGCDEYAYRRV